MPSIHRSNHLISFSTCTLICAHNISLELSLDRPLGRLASPVCEALVDNVPASGGV